MGRRARKEGDKMTGDGEQERQAKTVTGRREDERQRGLLLKKEKEQRTGRGWGSFLSIFLNSI